MTRRIHLHASPAKPEAAKVRDALAAALPRFGLERAATPAEADLAIALGGDGTIIRAAKAFPGTPVAGFNLGGLGYLATVGRQGFEEALAAIAAGRYTISRRSMLEAALPGGASAAALNDIVLTRELSGRAAALDLSIDGSLALECLADGLVFATPTGSTAYSLAAGGPVLMPECAAFVATPMNPHAPALRPMVVPDSSCATVEVRGRDPARDGRIGVYADGDPAATLSSGQSVCIRKSPQTALIVQLEGCGSCAAIARKLGWAASSRAS